jgi:hypothetical protein
MTDWKRTLYLQPEWDQASNDEIPIQKLAGVIAERLKALADFGGEHDYVDDEKRDLIDEFEDMSRDDTLTVADFDGVMQSLYDWGDRQLSGQFFDAEKVCWIDRFKQPAKATP